MANSIWDRRLPRVAYRVPVRFRAVDGEDEWRGECLNISEGGLFLASEHSLDSGTEVSCVLSLSDQMRRIRGRVVWVRPGDRGPDEPAGLGVQFVDVSSKNAALLRDVVGLGKEESFPVHVWFDGTSSPAGGRGVLTSRGIVLRSPLPFLKTSAPLQFEFGGGDQRYTGSIAQVDIATDEGQPHLLIHIDVAEIREADSSDLIALPPDQFTRDREPGDTGKTGAKPLSSGEGEGEGEGGQNWTARASESRRIKVIPGDGIAELRIPIRGKTSGLEHFRLADPNGLAINLPDGKPDLAYGDYRVLRHGVSGVRIHESQGSTLFRVFFFWQVPDYEVEATDDTIAIRFAHHKLFPDL